MASNNLSSLTFKYNGKTEFSYSSDPLHKIIKTFEDIKAYLLKEKNKIKCIKHLYFGKNEIHSMLYYLNKIIKITYEDKTQKSLAYIFYLDLLIKDDPWIINYIYSIDYIKILNDQQKEINSPIKLIIKAKIILDLITNFVGSDEFIKEEHEELLMTIKKENEKIIEDYKDLFYDVNIFLRKNIDEIYIEIIIKLIKERTFENYEYTLNLMNQLDMMYIYLSDEMLQRLSDFLNSNECLNNYLIINEKDLCNEKKVHFYFILIKYILKSSIYIYSFPFLLNTRKRIINLLKNNKIKFEIPYDHITNKKYYILKFIVDSEYYVKKYNIEKNNYVVENLIEYYPKESIQNDIYKREANIKKNKVYYEEFLQDYLTAKKNNKRYEKSENKLSNKPKEIKEIKNEKKKRIFDEFHETDSEIILNIVNKSIFILNRNNDNKLYFEKIYICKSKIEITECHKDKILNYIENIKTKEKKDSFMKGFNELCKFANKYMEKLDNESKATNDIYEFYFPNKNEEIIIKNFNDDINNNSIIINLNESINQSINSSVNNDAIYYKKAILKNITLMKKMIRDNKTYIFFLNNNNELFYYENNLIIKRDCYNIFKNKTNENREKTQLKIIGENTKDDDNNKFKVNDLCILPKTLKNNKEDISYYLFGVSENDGRAIKLYSFKNEKYKYIKDIITEKNIKKNDTIKHIEIIEKYNNLDNIQITEQTENSNIIDAIPSENSKKYYLFVHYNNEEVDLFDLKQLLSI